MCLIRNRVNISNVIRSTPGGLDSLENLGGLDGLEKLSGLDGRENLEGFWPNTTSKV